MAKSNNKRNNGKKKGSKDRPQNHGPKLVTGGVEGRVKLFKKPKGQDADKWPFIVDEVVVIRPWADCVAVSMKDPEGTELFFALNGYASMLTNLEPVHDAGYAIVDETGKRSIQPFIMAGLELKPMTETSDLNQVTRIYREARSRKLIKYCSEL